MDFCVCYIDNGPITIACSHCDAALASGSIVVREESCGQFLRDEVCITCPSCKSSVFVPRFFSDENEADAAIAVLLTCGGSLVELTEEPYEEPPPQKPRVLG